MKSLNIAVFSSLLFFSASSYALEIIPILGFRAGGDFVDIQNDKNHTLESAGSYGLILSFPYERGKTIEVYYSHQSTQLNSLTLTTPVPTSTGNIPITIDYLHLGGTTPISEDNNLQTFVSGGLGFTYLSPDFPDAQSDLRASLSIGLGLRWAMTERIALRLETRALATMYNNNSAIFCNGGCTIKVNGNFFMQGEVFAGLGFSF
jgi:hypothetical protein